MQKFPDQLKQEQQQEQHHEEEKDDYDECQGILMCPFLCLFPCYIYDVIEYLHYSQVSRIKAESCSYSCFRNCVFFSFMPFQHPLYAALQSGSCVCMYFSWYCLCGQFFVDNASCMQPSPVLSPPSIRGYDFLRTNDVNITNFHSSPCVSSDDFKCGTGYSLVYSAILYKYDTAGLYYAKYLFDNGCDANFASSSGDTSIHQIARHMRKKFRRREEESGRSGYDIMNRTSSNRNRSRLKYIRDDLKYLIKKGCDVNAANSRGKTALHYSINGLDTDTTRCLLDLGASFGYKDADNYNAYEYAFKDFDEAPTDNKIDIYIEDLATTSLKIDNCEDIIMAYDWGDSEKFVLISTSSNNSNNRNSNTYSSSSDSLSDYLTEVTYKPDSACIPPLRDDLILQLYKIIILLLENGIIFKDNNKFLEKKSIWFRTVLTKCQKEMAKVKRLDSARTSSKDAAAMSRYFREKCGMQKGDAKAYTDALVNLSISSVKELKAVYIENKDKFFSTMKEIKMKNDDFEVLLQSFI